MLKKLLSVILIGSILSVVPLIAGCEEPDQIKTEKKTEVKKTDQHTVVE